MSAAKRASLVAINGQLYLAIGIPLLFHATLTGIVLLWRAEVRRVEESAAGRVTWAGF